jgi:hypothetical protein
MVWDRIEAFIAWRWTSRAVVWIVEAQHGEGGNWKPTLTPATITTVESWDPTNVWVTASPPLDPSPNGGYWLPWTSNAPFRFTGTAGVNGSTVPEAVKTAFRRLAEYMASDPEDIAGASRFRMILAQREIEMDYDRSPTWLAMALRNSGAADLLRPYRRAQ